MPAAEAVWVVTVEEAARLIGKNPKTVYKWLKEGLLPARRVGGSWLIPRREVALFPGGRWHGANYETRCRCAGHSHDDRNPSLGITQGEDGRILFCCQKGHSFEEILASVGLAPKDVAPSGPSTNGTYPGGRFTAIYRYDNEDGTPRFEKRRHAPGSRSRFSLWLPGAEEPGLGDTPMCLYGLPRLLRTEPGEVVCIVEGEKDCENVWKTGTAATTNPEGASLPGDKPKWREEYTRWLRDRLPGRRFVIFADNDEAGFAHAEAVFRSLSRAGLKVQAAALSGLKEKQDISDWLGQHSREEFLALLAPEPHPLDLKVLDGPGLAAADLPVPEPIIPHLLYRGFSTLIAGDSKLGKSSLLLRGLLAAAAGGWWLDNARDPANRLEAARVLFLNFEDPLFLTRDRAQKMCHPEQLPTGFLTMEPPYGYKLREVVEWVADSHRRLRLDAVVFDPIAVAAEWNDETDNSEVALTFKLLQRLAAETQLAVLSAHHVTKKPGERGLNIRGASAIKANVLGYLVLEPHEGLFRLNGINKLVGEWDVLLDRREEDYSWWIAESRAGSTRTPRHAAREAAKADLFALIRDEPGISTERLVILTGESESTCRRYLAELETAGVIAARDLEREAGQRGRPGKGWFLTGSHEDE